MFCFVSGIRSSLVFCFGVIGLFPYLLPCHFGGWERIQVLGFTSISIFRVGRLEGYPGNVSNSPMSCLSFGFPLSGLDGGETNTVANCFFSGNAAVGVSATAGLLAGTAVLGRESVEGKSGIDRQCQQVGKNDKM